MNTKICTGMVRSGVLSRNIFICSAANNLKRSNIEISTKTEGKLRREDNVPDNFRLVYRAPMSHYINAAHSMSVINVTTLAMIGSWKTYLTTCILGLPLASILEVEPYTQTEIIGFLVGFGIINTALWRVSTRYAIRFYSKDEGKSSRHICIVVGNLPLTSRKIEFEGGEMRQARIWNHIPWSENIFCIGSKKIMLLDQYFRTPADLNNMLSSRRVE